MESKILLTEFLESYRQSLGVDGAQELLRQVITKAGLYIQEEFTKGQALQICEQLKQYPGYIGIIGGILKTRILLR